MNFIDTPEFKKKIAARGVDLVSESNVVFRCQKCGEVWSPNIQPGGKLPRNYWGCPNKCNWSKPDRP